MSVSSLALSSSGWRDYFGMWNPFVEPWLAPLELSECHAPRLVVLPQIAYAMFSAAGKIEYNFHLVRGSIIWGLFAPPLALNSGSDIPTIQITDVNLQHQFFQEPISTDQLAVTDGNDGFFPPFFLLPCPHPVVGDGLFSFEAWGTPGDTFVMLLGVGEVTPCPVR
jgi:hypothetical protein